MSKAKRIRQQNRRRAFVHGNNVRNSLERCPYGSCFDCRTPEQQSLVDLARVLHKDLLDVQRAIASLPTKKVPRPPYRHQKPPRRRYLARARRLRQIQELLERYPAA